MDKRKENVLYLHCDQKDNFYCPAWMVAVKIGGDYFVRSQNKEHTESARSDKEVVLKAMRWRKKLHIQKNVQLLWLKQL